MSMIVLKPGLLTTIQDLGRVGYQKHGVIVSGAMDTFSMRLSNILVGNKEDEAVLEITLLGPSLNMKKDTLFSITGADIYPTIDGKIVPRNRPIYLNKDTILKFGFCKLGCRAYLSAAGGFDVPEVMESKSTYIRAKIGGYFGRPLKKGDVIEFGSKSEESINIINSLSKKDTKDGFIMSNWTIKEPCSKDYEPNVIRVFRDRQYEEFSKDSLDKFFNSEFTIQMNSDRMGYRLSGVQLELKKSMEMISEAVSFGTVQVPPDGNPIILLADRQTTGGYPKLVQVASVDLRKIAQLKPRDKIKFKEISLKHAEKLYFQKEKYIRDLKTAVHLVIDRGV